MFIDQVYINPLTGRDVDTCSLCKSLSYVVANRPKTNIYINGTLDPALDTTDKYPFDFGNLFTKPSLHFSTLQPVIMNVSFNNPNVEGIFKIDKLEKIDFHNFWIKDVPQQTKLLSLIGSVFTCYGCVFEDSSGDVNPQKL